MKPAKILLPSLILIGVGLFSSTPISPQVEREGTISFVGIIDHVPNDQKFIVVNERRVFLSSETKIVHATGSLVKRDHLKRGLSVSVEGTRKPEGIYAKKITLLVTSKGR